MRLSRLALLATLAAACGPPTEMTPPPPPPPPPLTGAGPFVVSNPVAHGAAGAAPAGPVDPGPLTYISLAPGSLPGATAVRILVERTGSVVSAPLLDGGLDPVAVAALAGDTISLTVEPAGVVASVLRFTVSIRKPPVIVRTRPVKNKRDVPLNIRIEVIFSEPIDFASLTPENFVLRAGSSSVTGVLIFTDGTRTAVEFTPTGELSPATDYELVLRSAIQDLDGTPLEAGTSIPFTTASPPPPAPGELTVTTSTSGIELVETGYGISVDGGVTQPIGLNGSITALGLSPGPHTVKLNGLGTKCWLLGTNPRLANIPLGGSAAVHFTVTCAGTGLTQLAFVRDGEIYLINSDGTGLVQLSNVGPSRPGYAAWATDLAWSPDGRRLAFGIEDDSEAYPAAINIMNADGSTVNRLTDRGSEIWGSASPAWSPDGRVIVFSSFRLPQIAPPIIYGLFTMEADGAQDPVMLFGQPGVSYHNHTPAWSPDGRTIVFTKPGVEPQFQDLYVMNADGSDVRPLLEAPRSGPAIAYRQPAWSPDGQTIVVVSCNAAEARCDLSVLNADGSGLRVIAPDAGRSRPTWSPDGRMIAFESASSVRFVRVDGSGSGLLVSNGHSPAWRP